jgi:hypothetical protein
MRLTKSFVIIFLIMFTQTLEAGLLTAYVVPSARGIDLSSPRGLALSTARNYRSNAIQPYGHGMFHLKCSIVDGDALEHDELSGINLVNLNDANNLVLRHGYGLGSLFAVLPGQLDTRERTTYVLRSYMNAGAAAFIQYKVNSTTCSRLVQFIREFRERGVDTRYGLTARPRYGEGTDCTALLAALLEVAGLQDVTIDAIWRRTVRVPANLIGGPLTGNYIPPRRFIMRPFLTRSWASPNQAHFVAQLYITDNLISHILNRWNQGLSPLASQELQATMAYIENTKGFIIDARSVPTPDEPFWFD